MQFVQTDLPGVVLIEPDVHLDGVAHICRGGGGCGHCAPSPGCGATSPVNLA